tara:strand:- start:522 stop:665 length:144 start_codon:yes stop_codon:yes gene_type:complete
MPHPFYMRKPNKELPEKAVKSDIRVGTLIKNIFNNLGEIIKILVKWR